MAVLWRETSEFTLFACLFLCLSSIVPLYLLTKYYGWDKALHSFGTLSLFAYAIEILGVTTGFPYGNFRYFDGLGPLIGGVPWLLPFAWIPLLLAVWQIAIRTTKSLTCQICFSAGALVALDLILDPGAVALKLWKYQAGGVYFDVPWTNFAGWILSGSLGAWLVSSFLPEPRGRFVYWMLPLASTLGFWTAVCLRHEYEIPTIIGVGLFAALITLARRDENPRLC